MKNSLSAFRGAILRQLLLILAVLLLASCGGGGGGATSSGGSGGTGGSGYSAADMQGYQWIISNNYGTDAPHPYVFHANGSVSYLGASPQFAGGTYTVGADGTFNATMYFNGGGIATLTGVLSADKSRVVGTHGGAMSGGFTLAKTSTSAVGMAVTVDGLPANIDGKSATQAFTKIGADGDKLPAGTAAWSCVLDNQTGLMWEEKTTDGGLRDWRETYRWYDPDSRTNGGFAGYEHSGNNTWTFVKAVNALGLCGHSDWRLPDRSEMASFVEYNKSFIGSTYYSNTFGVRYWTSTPSADDANKAWFIGVNASNGDKYDGNAVRLVRSGQ